jgi:hypothetical protein
MMPIILSVLNQGHGSHYFVIQWYAGLFILFSDSLIGARAAIM